MNWVVWAESNIAKTYVYIYIHILLFARKFICAEYRYVHTLDGLLDGASAFRACSARKGAEGKECEGRGARNSVRD